MSLPKTVRQGPVITAIPKRTYANAHAYHIHSVSACSDAETFISADDLRVNLWHLDANPEHCFNLVDLKPGSIEELSEVITSCAFHPTFCSLFGYSTSKGAIRIGDMREAALCDRACINLQCTGESAGNSSNFFAEIVASISDCKFAGDYLVASRDYLNVRVWDVRNCTRPLSSIPVHDNVKQKLCDLYENDCIFDRFRLAWTCDGRQIVTGSYGDRVRALDLSSDGAASGWAEEIVADRGVFQLASSTSGLSTRMKGLRRMVGKRVRSAGSGSMAELQSGDWTRKVLNLAVHPGEMSMAVAATSNLFVFTQT